MSRRNPTTRPGEDGRVAPSARADPKRSTAEQGVSPFTSLKELAASPELAAGFDVDEFLRAVLEERTHPSGRGEG